MQMPLEEFTKNARERSPVVNWVLRFSSSVGSLTIGSHKNTQFEGRRGTFCENRKSGLLGRVESKHKKRRWLCVKDRVQLFPGLRMAKHSKAGLTSGEFSENRNSVTQLTFLHGEETVPITVFSNFEFYIIFWQILVHPISPLSLSKILSTFLLTNVVIKNCLAPSPRNSSRQGGSGRHTRQTT